jgi:carbonic anhydrase
VRSSIANLGTFPFIQKRIKDGLLSLFGLHFDLGTGELLSLEQETGRFAAIGEP